MLPLVSIVLPTYNGGRYIRQTIDSCVNQTFIDLELIVVIDGSTDDTEEIVRAYEDSRIKIIKSEENLGQAAAMNSGFAVASGDYFSWTSDDNVYMPDAFEVMVDYLERHLETSAVSTDCLVIDDKGKIYSYEAMRWQCFLYRREAAEKVGPHDPEARLLEDVHFPIRLEHATGPIARISRPYLTYRYHRQMMGVIKNRERPFMSVKVHYDLITKGITGDHLQSVFEDRMRTSAIYRDHDTIERMVAFAVEKNLPFVDDLKSLADYLKSPIGWLVNRVQIAIRSKKRAFKNRLQLYHYLISSKFRLNPSRDF